ncbi:MAG: hypothetical protein L0Y44_09430 [Phycisphaerales bacterium]|nr:hypothetical protein [Phycisphaerales bacterium]MCI0630860.1 hypothetical protein [Phycisphaerales bacterium]MCI0674672.1 hypothetical protein [Phycisphaerales bacterium]
MNEYVLQYPDRMWIAGLTLSGFGAFLSLCPWLFKPAGGSPRHAPLIVALTIVVVAISVVFSLYLIALVRKHRVRIDDHAIEFRYVFGGEYIPLSEVEEVTYAILKAKRPFGRSGHVRSFIVHARGREHGISPWLVESARRLSVADVIRAAIPREKQPDMDRYPPRSELG